MGHTRNILSICSGYKLVLHWDSEWGVGDQKRAMAGMGHNLKVAADHAQTFAHTGQPQSSRVSRLTKAFTVVPNLHPEHCSCVKQGYTNVISPAVLDDIVKRLLGNPVNAKLYFFRNRSSQVSGLEFDGQAPLLFGLHTKIFQGGLQSQVAQL